MHRIIYVSSETAPFSEAQLDALLRKSRNHNLASGITGLLLYKDGHFMQILEGPKPAVLALIAKIKKDPRHRDVSILMQSDTGQCEFKDWSMGFKRIDATTAREIPGYRDFSQLDLIDNQFLANPSESLGLLLAFKNARL
jgi:hypothetical protein